MNDSTRQSAAPAGARSAAHAGADELPRAGFLLLAGLAVFWGSNWPVMKIVVSEIPVWTFRSVCLLGGGAGILLIARTVGHNVRVPASEVPPLLLCATLNVVGWHLCSAYGVSLMAAGRAAIIAFTMPAWAAGLGTLVLGERLTAYKVLGLILGLAGLAVLIGPDIAAVGAAPLGAVFMLGAAVSWASGTVLMKRFPWNIPTTALAGWQLLAGAVPVTLGALLVDGVPDPAAYSTRALLATAYVLAMPMIFCHWAWFTVVRLFPAGIAAMGTLAIPVVGVFLSALVLGESVGWQELVALLLILSSLSVVLVLPSLRAR
ncbi:MAG: DMT family transporter [Gammaproteobacteria bacterium]|nr:DMT family transporter [Gammaproteobacteria bacterium]NIR84812.1 DMT family transporter [Gammaproteobacteria bacterium]NIR91526.1 DMT family transporter [Gammaproteobacteria bacterium]NIU05859.1 DMT family transporter [Gammaproteobacteria bacterium]NIV76714.1 EamA family transporter [Gammaproteobacteria bacterium]